MPGGRGSRNGRGGYQAPANPAAVSGPSALSQRTDGGPAQPIRPIPTGDGPEGTRQASIMQQQGAPLAAAPAIPAVAPVPPTGATAGPPPIQPGSLTPLNAPTNRPDEPVQAGLPIGPGPGIEALGPQAAGDDTLAVLRSAYAQYPNPDLLRLILDAEQNQPRG